MCITFTRSDYTIDFFWWTNFGFKQPQVHIFCFFDRSRAFSKNFLKTALKQMLHQEKKNKAKSKKFLFK